MRPSHTSSQKPKKDARQQVCREVFLQQLWTHKAQKGCSMEEGRINDLRLHCGNRSLLV